ncbi:hypothetical protein [Szabonella alba]|uniref:Uncharacterized protein n=1 Tax=Szabonella alba TaxID=2804194 RepID=A0A8K0Y1B7_9RHOB|nr:hypothetical protein [Szabonella alba]MBL4917717.1 hypothetical protein [Szabonella alba]
MTGAGIGHNRGPELAPGTAWRRHCWGAARKALLPHLPIEVLRGRLKRAAELGLDYSTYAGIRATTGRDVVAVLFSSNALGMERGGGVTPDRKAHLAAVKAARIGLATPPLTPGAMLEVPLDAAWPAPPVLSPFRVQAEMIRAALGSCPGDGAILVGGYGGERDWAMAGRLAAYLPAERVFATG